MENRDEYSMFVAASLAAFIGGLFIVGFDQVRSFEADVFYVTGWLLVGVALLSLGLGVRVIVRSGRHTAGEPNEVDLPR